MKAGIICKCLNYFLPFAQEVIFSQASVKGVDAKMLEQISKQINKDIPIQIILNPKDAFATALKTSKPKDIIIVTGSIYLVGEAMTELK